MAIQSRSRSTRRSGDDVQPSARAAHAAEAKQSRHPHNAKQQHLHHPHPHRGHPTSPPASDDEHDHGPPAKRRKLSIRSKQTTLDHHFTSLNQSQPAKPPTKVTVTQPHGPLLETINGVQNVLDANEDEISTGKAAGKALKTTPVAASRTPSTTNNRKDEKRTLRSQDDGPRLKSELAIYFPTYEDIIFDVPREEELIHCDTALYITDDAAKQQISPNAKSPKSGKTAASSGRNGTVNDGSQTAATPQRSNSNQFNGSPSLNLDLISRTVGDNPEDPLTDDYYSKSHKRAERKEKQLRNIEKERAMHEKVQLDRLLDGLQGHDWLKVLGITGITDGEAKKYEQKRDYFIAEVQALVDKFKEWKEQEKKQRLDKEAALAAQEAEEEADEVEFEEGEGEDDDISENDSTAPPSSDLNASAARQLQQETASALKSSRLNSLNSPSAMKTPSQLAQSPLVPSPETPITSFYSKRHLRDAALGKSRHGRNVTAFGHPLPEMQEREFELPDGYVTADMVRANAREKRRRKRASVADAL